jgi:hypothetical protein
MGSQSTSMRFDATVAAVMAHYRAIHDRPISDIPLIEWA